MFTLNKSTRQFFIDLKDKLQDTLFSDKESRFNPEDIQSDILIIQQILEDNYEISVLDCLYSFKIDNSIFPKEINEIEVTEVIDTNLSKIIYEIENLVTKFFLTLDEKDKNNIDIIKFVKNKLHKDKEFLFVFI